MNTRRSCSADSCVDPAVTVFAQQELCLNHFVARCYEDLERLDRKGRCPRTNYSDVASLKSFVDECSRRALEVSLSCEHLDNLQRGRLLDILLWAGELCPLEPTPPEQRFVQSA